MCKKAKRAVDVFLSEKLIYVPLSEKAFDIVIQWRSTPEIIRYYRNSSPITSEEHMKWYYTQYLNDVSRYDWTVYSGDDAVGFVALSDINYEQKSCEISYTIGNRLYRNRRLSEEMIFAIMGYGRNFFNLQTFYAEIHKDNIASQKAVASCGFQVEKKGNDFWRYIRRYANG